MKKFLITTGLSLFILTACSTSNVNTSPRTLGQDNAKVTIQEFSDPECPACGVISPQMEKFVRNNPELARLEYFHYPLSYHDYAFIAAEASECAGDQGKFWEYIGIIFETQANLDENYIYNVADTLGLNRVEFDACVDSNKYKNKILSHLSEGKQKELSGTPSFYIDNKLVKWSGAETFKAYLEGL